MIRWLGPLGRKIAESTKAGRIMALIGVVAIVVSLALIYMNSVYYDTSITKKGLKIVTIRQPTEAELQAMLFGWRVVKCFAIWPPPR